MVMITRSKGGTAEREVDIGHIQVPDLWHIYEQLREITQAAGVIFDFESKHRIKWTGGSRPFQTVKVEMTLSAAAQAASEIYECWHLCHDLKNHIAATS